MTVDPGDDEYNPLECAEADDALGRVLVAVTAVTSWVTTMLGDRCKQSSP